MNLMQYYPQKGEMPLDRIVEDGGFCSIFRTIGCVGDSLSSGEFDSVQPDGTILGRDLYEHSWGQYLARMCGSTVYNFSAGGMTAREYCESFAEEKGFWSPQLACDAYIIALGVNDIINFDHPVGSVEQLDHSSWKANTGSFIAYYGQIIQRLKEISPRAFFFLMTIPRDDLSGDRSQKIELQCQAVRALSQAYDRTYLLDFNRYAPVYDEAFHKQFFLGGHMNPCGYYLTAKMVASYIDYLIRNQMEDFLEAAYIRTPYAYDETKKNPEA